MRVIVLGASGFIGRNFVLKCPTNWEVVAIYNQSTEFPAFVKNSHLTNVLPLQCDLRNIDSVKPISQKIGIQFDVAVFLAANGDPALSVENPTFDLQSNVITLLNFLQCFEVCRLLYLSSGAVYDGLRGFVHPETRVNPVLPYGISKLTAEQYVKSYATRARNSHDYVILRFFGGYGPFEPPRKIFSRLIRSFAFELKREFTIRGDGCNLVDAMYIDDCVRGLVDVIASRKTNLTVDFCYGKPISVIEMITLASKIFGQEDVRIIQQGETEEYIQFYVSGERMKALFGFEPTIGIEEGLNRYYQFMKKAHAEVKFT